MNSKSKVTPNETSWATLTLEIKSAPNSSNETVDDIEERLDNLAGLLAEEENVEGVETRDTSTCELAPLSTGTAHDTSPLQSRSPSGTALCSQSHHPLPLDGKSLAIIVYTAPHALERIETLALQMAINMDLDVVAKPSIHTNDDWRDNWKKYYHPIQVAQGRLIIRPTWIESTHGVQTRELVLDPGRAFGTGLHETTRLCLDMIDDQEEQEKKVPSTSSRILDLGCGSGILGLAYTKLYEDKVEHCDLVDLDLEATEAAFENTEANDLSSKISVIAGTIEDLANKSYNLIFANIRSETLIASADAICRHLQPGGVIYLSGILIEESNDVRSAFEKTGLDWSRSKSMADWCAIKMTKATP